MKLKIITDIIYKTTRVYPSSLILVNVSHYFVQPPLGKWCDSDWDADGYTDLEWEIVSVIVYDEDEGEKEFTDPSELASIYLNEEDVHKQILEQIEKEVYDDY